MSHRWQKEAGVGALGPQAVSGFLKLGGKRQDATPTDKLQSFKTWAMIQG